MKKQIVLLAALLGGTLAGNAQTGRIRKRWTDCSICIRWIKWKTLTEKT